MSRLDYTVYVHVIEARDIAPKDSNGTSDPYLNIACCGQEQKTVISRNTLHVLWDQVFVFEGIRLNRDEFERESIHIQLFDANTIVRNELIGQYSYGIEKVWSQTKPRHQFFKRWVTLVSSEDPDMPQGYILATITVLGPGDSPPHHQPDEEEAAHDVSIMKTPTIKNRRGYNLAFKVYRGENILKHRLQDQGGLDALPTDAFVSVRFNGLMTHTSTEFSTFTPEWNTHIILPVFTPCLSDNIDVQVGWHGHASVAAVVVGVGGGRAAVRAREGGRCVGAVGLWVACVGLGRGARGAGRGCKRGAGRGWRQWCVTSCGSNTGGCVFVRTARVW